MYYQNYCEEKDASIKRCMPNRQQLPKKKESNCPLCAIGHDANHTKIWDLKDMDADHVTAWSKGGATVFILFCFTLIS
jgi:hypothetical protein